MRTTLDLPEALMGEAPRLLGFKSKTDTVILSLTELVPAAPDR
jgi:Arc/MetJ family transcription regulator